MPRASGAHSEFVASTRTDLHALFERARAIDIRHHEESASEDVSRELSPLVAGLVERALGLASNLLNRYDAGAEAAGAQTENFDLAVDTLLAEVGETKVADLAFMAVQELRQRLARVRAHGPAADAWEMVCDCGSALRRVQKSLGALEQALCELEGLEPSLRFDSELEVSRQVRRQYRKLWRFVGTQGVVDARTVRNALRGAGTLCAMLVGRDVYCRLRERDRFELRQLQRRILAWLVQEPFDPKAGVRLWEDWAGFVEMLRQVNLRQELVQNDVLVLRAAEAALAAGELEAPLEQLSAVEGLDDDLDELRAQLPSREALLAEVQRVLARFAPEPASAPYQSSPSQF